MAGTVMPAPKFIGLDNNANPVSGGKLYTYVAGTTTPQATYTDVNLSVANTNPVILDSAGRATVFLSGTSYKFVLADADDVTLWTQDNVQAVAPFSTNLDIQGVAGENILSGQACYLSDGSGALTAGRWYLADADNAYSSSTPQVAMAPDAVDAGETGTFRLQGAVTKANAQADFVVGDTYFVSATAGLLSLSPGTNLRVMGQADSTTTIVISPNPPNIATTPTFIDGITVTSTDAGAAAAPYLDLYRESASPAASDQLGEIKFSGEDSVGNKQLYARVYGQIADPTSTSEDGQVRVSVVSAGTETLMLVLTETGQWLPDLTTQDIGSTAKPWRNAYLAATGVVDWGNGNSTLTASSGKLTLSGSGAGTLEVKGAVLPTVSNTPALGSSSLMWADLFLGDGAVVNFNNGDVTITHSTNTLTFAGASSGYIFNDGNVGIGTASPNTRLTVTGSASSIQLYHDVCSIRFASTPNRTNSWFVGANISDTVNGGFIIGTGADINTGTERIRIDSSGNVSLANANTMLGWVTTDNFTPAGGNPTPHYGLGRGAFGTNTVGISGYAGLALYTTGTERMRVPAAGGVQAVTTISVGNATPASTGAGITFPASQSASSDANTLDDYEEGTWTPTDGSGAGLTFTQAMGSYTKIGRLVHLIGFVQYPSTANGNTATIGGFPFAVANADSAQGHSTIGYSSDDTNARYLLPNKNTTNGVIYRNTGVGATNANLSGDYVYFGTTYPVA